MSDATKRGPRWEVVKKPIVVDVTLHHIVLGVAGNCSECPIALALSEMDCFWHPKVYVAGEIHVYEGDGKHWEAPLPEAATEFVREFDRMRTAVPFRFPVTLQSRRRIA